MCLQTNLLKRTSCLSNAFGPCLKQFLLDLLQLFIVYKNRNIHDITKKHRIGPLEAMKDLFYHHQQDEELPKSFNIAAEL